jgi:hypothetical protein
MANKDGAMSHEIVSKLIEVDKQLEGQIDNLQEKRDALKETIRTFTDGPRKGFSLHTTNRKPKISRGTQMTLGAVKKAPAKKKQAPKKSYAKRGSNGNTMEMTRQVLRNKGGEMTAREIRDQIRSDFGVEPVKSLLQMLYKNAAKGLNFYRNPKTGAYGLLTVAQKAA